MQDSGIGRREFIRRMAASGLALKTLSNEAAGFRRAIRAVAFDAFPILDPRPVFALVEELYPERGVDLSNVWRARQFEYTWLRTMSRRYTDFWQVTDDALVFAAKAVKVELTPEKRARLMDAYLNLRCWPGARRAALAWEGRPPFGVSVQHDGQDAGSRNSELSIGGRI